MEPELKYYVAEQIRAAMQRRGLTGGQLAERLGWGHPFLSRRLTGLVDFNVSELEQLSRVLNVRPASLVGIRTERGSFLPFLPVAC